MAPVGWSINERFGLVTSPLINKIKCSSRLTLTVFSSSFIPLFCADKKKKYNWIGDQMCGVAVLSERGSKAIQAIFSSAPFQRRIEREADWIAGMIEREIAVQLNRLVVAYTVSGFCVHIGKWRSWNVPENIHESCTGIFNGWNAGTNVATLIFSAFATVSYCRIIALHSTAPFSTGS